MMSETCTLNNLHVLSAMCHNDKLMTNNDMFNIYSPTTCRGLLRTWYGEDRSHNIRRIRQTVDDGIAACSKLLQETNFMLESPLPRDDQLCLRIDSMAMRHIRMCDGVCKAKEGLQNMLQTYRDDAGFASQLQLIVLEIGDFENVMNPHTQKLRSRHIQWPVVFTGGVVESGIGMQCPPSLTYSLTEVDRT